MKYLCDEFLNIILKKLLKGWIGKVLRYYDILIMILDYITANSIDISRRFKYPEDRLFINIARFKIWQRNIK